MGAVSQSYVSFERMTPPAIDWMEVAQRMWEHPLGGYTVVQDRDDNSWD